MLSCGRNVRLWDNSDFMDDGWSAKHLHKTIMLSSSEFLYVD
jgi:hypothetical protein